MNLPKQTEEADDKEGTRIHDSLSATVILTRNDDASSFPSTCHSSSSLANTNQTRLPLPPQGEEGEEAISSTLAPDIREPKGQIIEQPSPSSSSLTTIHTKDNATNVKLHPSSSPSMPEKEKRSPSFCGPLPDESAKGASSRISTSQGQRLSTFASLPPPSDQDDNSLLGSNPLHHTKADPPRSLIDVATSSCIDHPHNASTEEFDASMLGVTSTSEKKYYASASFLPLFCGSLRSVRELLSHGQPQDGNHRSDDVSVPEHFLLLTPGPGPAIPFVPNLHTMGAEERRKMIKRAKGAVTAHLVERFAPEMQRLLPVIEDALQSLIDESHRAIADYLRHECAVLEQKAINNNTATADDAKLVKLRKAIREDRHKDVFTQKPYRVFEVAGLPGFSLREYLEFIADESYVSPSSFVGALILLNRLLTKLNGNPSPKAPLLVMSAPDTDITVATRSSVDSSRSGGVNLFTTTSSSPRTHSELGPASSWEQPGMLVVPRSPDDHHRPSAPAMLLCPSLAIDHPSLLLQSSSGGFTTTEDETSTQPSSPARCPSTGVSAVAKEAYDSNEPQPPRVIHHHHRRQFYVTNLNIMKLFASSVRVASKVLELVSVKNKQFAAAARFREESLLEAEERLLQLLDWNVHISAEEYHQYAQVIRGDFHREMTQLSATRTTQPAATTTLFIVHQARANTTSDIIRGATSYTTARTVVVPSSSSPTTTTVDRPSSSASSSSPSTFVRRIRQGIASAATAQEDSDDDPL